MNNWIKTIVLGCAILLSQGIDINVYAQMNGGYSYSASEDDGNDVGYGGWMGSRQFNGKFIGNNLILNIYPEGGNFKGELRVRGKLYQVDGVSASNGWVKCSAKEEDSEETIIFNVQDAENGLRYAEEGKDTVFLRRIPFPEVEGVYQGKDLVLKIGKDEIHGEYTGTIQIGANQIERNLNKKRVFTAKEMGGCISGVYQSINGENRVRFAIEYEEPNQLYFVEEGEGKRMTNLKPSKSTEHMMKARAAKVREDWATVKSEAKEVISINEYHQQEAGVLLAEAERWLSNEKTVQRHLKKAERYATKAATKGDWLNVKAEAEEALKLSPRNEKAIEFQKQAERELEVITEKADEVEEYLSEAREEKRRGNWDGVIVNADRALGLDKNNAKAKDLKKEGEKQIQISQHLNIARKAKQKKDWKTVKNETDALLYIEPNHYEAQQLKKEAEKELDVEVKKQRDITNHLDNAEKARQNKDWRTVEIEDDGDDVGYGEWIRSRQFNGKFMGSNVVLSIYPERENFKGELSINGRIYQVDGVSANGGWVKCTAKEENSEETIIFNIQSAENGLWYAETGKDSVILRRIPFPEVEGVYQGENLNLLLGIKKDDHGEYSGTLVYGDNKLERFLNQNLGLNVKRVFTAEEKGGCISGVFTKINGKKEVRFTIDFEEPDNLYFVDNLVRIKLKASGPTEHLMKAREAKKREDWKTVISETKKIISDGKYHLQEAIALQNEAYKELDNARWQRNLPNY